MTTILPPENKGNYTPAPAGSHVAMCYGVVDCGTQAFTWQGETKINPQIALFFELSNELMENGKPYTISIIMTMSSHKKAKLRSFLEAWRGLAFTDAEFGKFNISQLIGIQAMLNIVHTTKDDGSVKAKINGVMRVPKGTPTASVINERLHFTFDDFSQSTYDKLTDFWKDMIAKSPEYKQAKGIGHTHEEDVTGHLEAPMDEEVPF
jgi:hypothetical protein